MPSHLLIFPSDTERNETLEAWKAHRKFQKSFNYRLAWLPAIGAFQMYVVHVWNLFLGLISVILWDNLTVAQLPRIPLWGTEFYRAPWRQWHPTPVLSPGKSHGQRSLVGCSPWGRWGLDTTKRLPFHFSLSCIGEGNGNPLQCSCLENPRDGRVWWAAIFGVAQSRTRLKRLSSSSFGSGVEGVQSCIVSTSKVYCCLIFTCK